ncbi:MAG: LEA type 2 family protein [Nitrospirae bacterium]|nr:LEA type 2 family protein [Nitrospirota bacterium]MBI3594300.1 LEA type 2 family protein [Nitrospirota bacterium]
MVRRFYLSLLFLSLASGGCSPNLIKPDLALQEIELTGVSFSSIDLAFLIKVTNPNSVGVTVDKLNYRLELNEETLGAGELITPISLKESGSEVVTLPFSTSINGLSHLLRTILGESDVNYKLTGKVVLSKFWTKREFPFESKGMVPLNRTTFHH